MAQQEQNHETEANIEPVNTETTEQEKADLGTEFKELGRQLMRAMRSMTESDELRHLGNEIVETMRDLGEEVQQTFERTKEKEEVKAVGERAKRVTKAMTSGLSTKEVTGDLQSGLSQALRTLNNELNKLIDQIQARSARVSDEVEGTVREAEGEIEDVGAQATRPPETESRTAGEAGIDMADETSQVEDTSEVLMTEQELESEVRAGEPDEGAEFPRTGETHPRETEKNQPHYLGDKADVAVQRLEESGGEMSENAETLLEEGRAELRAIVDETGENDGQDERPAS